MQLLKVIRDPVAANLPLGALKSVYTYNSENVVGMRDHEMNLAALAIDANIHKRMNNRNK